MGDAGSEDPFEGRVDGGQESADAVADGGGLTGEVVIDADEDLQFRQRLVPGVDPAQGVRQGAGVSVMRRTDTPGR